MYIYDSVSNMVLFIDISLMHVESISTLFYVHYLLYCCIVVLLYCCIVVLLYCCIVVLLYCCIVVLLYCCIVVLFTTLVCGLLISLNKRNLSKILFMEVLYISLKLGYFWLTIMYILTTTTYHLLVNLKTIAAFF